MENIINALETSADVILADVINTGYTVKSSQLTEELEKLPADERTKVYDVVNVLIKHTASQ